MLEREETDVSQIARHSLVRKREASVEYRGRREHRSR